MVSMFDSRSRRLGSSTDRDHCVAFLHKKLYSHSAPNRKHYLTYMYVEPGVLSGWHYGGVLKNF